MLKLGHWEGLKYHISNTEVGGDKELNLMLQCTSLLVFLGLNFHVNIP